MATAPSTDNYFIGKATLSFKKTGGADYVALGNVSECEISMNIEKLDHFSAMAGVKSKDKSVVISKAATIRMVMEELTIENMALAMGGTVATASDGTKSFGMLEGNAVEGSLKITGTNEIGPKYQWIGNVSFTPSGSFSPISDEWGSVEATGEVLVYGNGAFGVWTEL